LFHPPGGVFTQALGFLGPAQEKELQGIGVDGADPGQVQGRFDPDGAPADHHDAPARDGFARKHVPGVLDVVAVDARDRRAQGLTARGEDDGVGLFRPDEFLTDIHPRPDDGSCRLCLFGKGRDEDPHLAPFFRGPRQGHLPAEFRQLFV